MATVPIVASERPTTEDAVTTSLETLWEMRRRAATLLAEALVEDVLAEPGMVDLTAHVDFGRIAAAGEGVGLKTECLETQRRFLTWIMAETLKPGVDFGEWTQSRVRQFQTLTHPQHLGTASG